MGTERNVNFLNSETSGLELQVWDFLALKNIIDARINMRKNQAENLSGPNCSHSR